MSYKDIIEIEKTKEIAVSDSTIYDNVTRIYGDSFIENCENFIMFCNVWANKNSTILGQKNLGKKVTFYDTDESALMDTFGIDKKVITGIVNKSLHIDKKWLVSCKPLNVVQYILIFFYYDNRNKFKNMSLQPYELANFMLAARFFSTIQRRQFKYEPDENTMQYTLDNLSNKFIITKLNTIYEIIEYIAKTNFESFLNDKSQVNSRADNILDNYMRKLNTRISSSLVNISREFYKNHEEQKKIYTESSFVEFEEGKKDINAQTNISNNIATALNRVISNWNVDSSVNVEILRVCCTKTKTSYPTMYKVIEKMSDEKDELITRIFKNIINYYLVTILARPDQFKSFHFFNTLISAYRISNSKNEYVIAIKEDLNALLNKYSKLYFQTGRASTKANFRYCLYLYLIRIFNKLI